MRLSELRDRLRASGYTLVATHSGGYQTPIRYIHVFHSDNNGKLLVEEYFSSQGFDFFRAMNSDEVTRSLADWIVPAMADATAASDDVYANALMSAGDAL